MKKTTLLLAGMMLALISFSQSSLTKEERSKAIDHLKMTQTDLVKLVAKLNDQQLNYRPNPEAWSIAECVEHIAISEKNLTGMVAMSMQEEANPEKRSELAMDDDQLLGLITNREQKVKTRPEFEPENSFGDFKQTLQQFKSRRKSSINYVKSTDHDLRNHYLPFPFGLIDSYQAILFMSGHTQRHTAQIKEIMEMEGFPE